MNIYLEKIAEINTREHTKDLINTGVIAGLGTVGNMVSDRVINGHWGNAGKAGLIGGGVGLAADYAGVKLNKVINKHLDKGQS